MDGAQVEWRSRFTEHGLDLRDERDLHAFVAGLVSFAEYVEHVVLPLHVIRCATGENVSLESSLAGGVDAIVSTLRPYLEAHVPPGTIGAEGD